MKKHIPNILTTYRLIVALLIPLLFFTNHYNTLTILFVLALLSDLIDGALARKWNVTSTYGKVVDVIGDKLLSLSASATFIVAINKKFIITLILELIIVITNLYKWIKGGGFKNKMINSKSSVYGKLKTWFLFVSLFVGYAAYKYTFLNEYIFPLVIATGIMQVITIVDYALKKDEISS